MLHKSFKPAKCKTSLKLAASRIKLLKNKKEVQVRQLKGELAKLLESGQVQTARIRVEHVVREEKSKEAYELIEIFCELIAARLPMIESQKNCPIDLKEAVSSVIFASPRCADIPELMDVRKHFKSKYGKEFVSAAVELRPECGVNRMLVEKLSAKAPDGPNKLKILTAIAEEHSIKWDPKSFSDSSSNPAADLLNGPNTFEKAGKISIQMEPIGVQPSTDHHNKGSPSVPVAFKTDERHNIPENENSPQQNFRSTLHSQKPDSTDVNANRINVTGHHISETRSSEINEVGTRYRHSSSGDQKNYSSDRQHWTMDFKDATAAAQAAAESAERASLAARAAAELSSRGIISRQSSSEWQKSSPSNLGAISRQSSSERQKPSPSNLGTISRQSSSGRQKSSPSNFKAEGPQEYASSNLQPQFRKDPVANAAHRSSMMDDNWINNDAKNFVGSKAEESCEPSLVKSGASNIDTNTSVTNFDAADAYSRKNSSYSQFNDYLGTGSTEEQPRNSDVQYVSDQPHGTGSRKISSPREARLGNDLNRAPSHEMLENDTDVNPFAMGKTNDYGNTVETSFNDEASVVFDDYGVDDDFEIGHNYQRKESILDLSSPGGKMPINLSEATDTWIPKQDKYESPDKSVSHEQISEVPTSLFAENLRSSGDAFKSDDFLPATYDHSDGPSSESEEESEEAENAGKMNSGEFSKEQNLYSEKTEWTNNDSHGLAGFSYDEEKRSMTAPCSSSKFSPVREAKGKASPPSSPDIIQDTLIFEESTSEGYSALSFGKLKGGLRNQKSPRLPYANISSGSNLPSMQAGENYASKTENSTTISSSTGRGSFRSNASSHEKFHQNVEEKPCEEKGPRAKSNRSSYLDDSKDKFSEYTLSSNQELYSDEVGSKISKKSTSRVAEKYPGFHDDDDPEEVLARQNMNNSPRQATVLSRRTKTSPKNSNSYLKDSNETRTIRDGESERKASSNYHASTVPLKMKTRTNYSVHLEDPEQTQSSISFKKTSETKRSYNEERLRSSTKEQSSNAPQELDTQGSYESLKISFSREKTTAPLKTKAQRNNSDQIVNNEQPRSNKPSKQITEPKRSYREERSTSSSMEVPSISSPKLETQANSESLKREKSKAGEKASHVHPNLPDSDDFMAHFLSLRQNRK